MHLLMIFIKIEIDCFKVKNPCFDMHFIIKKGFSILSFYSKTIWAIKNHLYIIFSHFLFVRLVVDQEVDWLNQEMDQLDQCHLCIIYFYNNYIKYLPRFLFFIMII